MRKEMKKDLKKEFKIRRLLGDNYHLSTTYDIENERVKEWQLFREYENQDLYFSEFNKAIMTSEDSTEKDLVKFARKNHVYDFERLHIGKGVCISYALLILCIVNAFIKSDLIFGIWLGMTIYLWIDLLLDWIFSGHNFRIKMKLLNEKFDLKMKVLLKKSTEEVKQDE